MNWLECLCRTSSVDSAGGVALYNSVNNANFCILKACVSLLKRKGKVKGGRVTRQLSHLIVNNANFCILKACMSLSKNKGKGEGVR